MKRLRLRVKPLPPPPSGEAAPDPLSADSPKQSVAVIRIATLSRDYSMVQVVKLLNYAIDHACELTFTTDTGGTFKVKPADADTIAVQWEDIPDD